MPLPAIKNNQEWRYYSQEDYRKWKKWMLVQDTEVLQYKSYSTFKALLEKTKERLATVRSGECIHYLELEGEQTFT